MAEEIKHCACGRVARFLIQRIDKRTKAPRPVLPVCGTCDSKVDIKNLVACGVRRPEAVKLNREVKKVKV